MSAAANFPMRSVRTTPAPPSLEEENSYLRQQLRVLTEEGRCNEAAFKRSHQRELDLLTAEDLPQLLQAMTQGMQHSFQLPCISLVLEDRDHELRHLLLNSGVPPYCYDDIQFCDQLSDLSPIYHRLTHPFLGPPTGEEHTRIFPIRERLRSIAILPMIRRGTLIGSLNLGSRDPSRFTRHHASDFLGRLATVAAICLENAANREHLIISGLTDALTGLHNRRYLERRLSEEVSRAQRYNQPLGCLFIDADHFKQVNDLHGHSSGDQVLREISLRVKECLRASDVATRYGGEEFALLLPQTDAREAFHLAERIRQRIAGHSIPIGDNKEIEVSVSIGVSELMPATVKNPGQRLIEDADSALYQAKRAGRNRVCAQATT